MSGATRRGRVCDFQSVIQHDHQEKPCRSSYASADTAIGRTRDGFNAGATTAYVVRKSDGVVIYDGPKDFELPVSEWVNWAVQ